jgi:hypothetical protein
VPACPHGHESDDPDWCDVCGLALVPAPPPPVPVARCRVCSAPLAGRFCEQCGHDSTAPHVGLTWRAVVRADPAWYEVVRRRNGTVPATQEFPRHTPERRHVLSGERIAIGRHSPTRGTAPDIDLAGFDPAVSAAHALLVARPDGGWDLVDLGSTNGTTLAVEDGPLRPHLPVPVADGTVVRLGAWTTITLTTA